jgi:4-hydroxybutyrate CoA-transferase
MKRPISVATSIARLKPGDRVFAAGGSGAPTVWIDEFLGDPARNAGIDLTTTAVAGLNPLNLDTLHPTARVSGLFMQPSLAVAQADGRFRHLPMTYGSFGRYLAGQPPFDLCVIQLSRPNGEGLCSMGPMVECLPSVIARARRIVGILNMRTPFIAGSASLPLDRLDDVIETDCPLPTYQSGKNGDIARTIADHLQGFIGDDAVLQTGLGDVPSALLASLADRKGLRFHSGMISDGIMTLHQSGALAAGQPQTSCALVGSTPFYDWAKEQDFIHVRGCDYTHDFKVLSSIDGLVAINSALEVDLFGQCNLEFAKGRAISAPGGAPDFAHAAKRSLGGLSIVALPALAGAVSRVRSRLGRDSGTTIARTDVDIIVTDQGAADLRTLSVFERAERLIDLAAPEMRAGLREDWREIAAQL